MPWSAGDSEKTVWRAEIAEPDYEPMEGCTTFQPVMQGDETICIVVGEGWDDTEFDARLALIAAAPELLAMLKVAQLWLDVDGRFDMQGINAAIAKAEGRS